ncbi:hypothetical protein F5B20DRAFT_535733 [Whalleya microplaca]|nr:hypothetical protein F5B20DRAFT_535733 [Whalleya microplaca]
MAEQTLSSGNTYTRPLGALEEFHYALAECGRSLNREHWLINFALRLRFPPSVPDPAPYLRRAWQVARHQYPALEAAVVPDTQKQLQLSVGPLDADSWAHDTFRIHAEYQDSNELFSILRPEATATCHWLPVSAELVFRSSHWRTDGMGLLLLGQNFLTILTDVLRLGLGATLDAYQTSPPPDPPLASSLEDLARACSQIRDEDKNDKPRAEIPALLEVGADAIVNNFLRGVPSIGLPTRENSENARPQASARVATCLNVETTAKIVAGCRAQGVSVTSATHAAIVRVTASYPQNPLAKCYAALAPADLRQALTAAAAAKGIEARPGHIEVYHTFLTICIENVVDYEKAKDFKTVAHELNAVYRRDIANFWDTGDGSGRVVSLLDLAEPYMRRTVKLFSQPVPEGLPPVRTQEVSGLGKLENVLQRQYVSSSGPGDKSQAKVELVDLWLGAEVLTRSLLFHVWSWRDQLNIAASYNKAFYEREFVIEVLYKVVRQLLAGLGI